MRPLVSLDRGLRANDRGHIFLRGLTNSTEIGRWPSLGRREAGVLLILSLLLSS